MNELIQIGPISPLRQRLIDDMTMRGFSTETQRNYLRDVGRFATWLRRSPHTASTEDIRQFQFEQHQAGVLAPTMNSMCSGDPETARSAAAAEPCADNRMRLPAPGSPCGSPSAIHANPARSP
ncbi:phage integrase N-terminal SAM-like domain-containing protein [Sphingopyxis sp. MSC1_008]|jgi:hypothetical protein